MNYLLDTNILIYLHDGRLLESLPTGGYACSVISEIEIPSWPGIAPETESERRGLLAALHSVKVDASVREAAIRLRREHRLKIPDAIIAASALTHDAILLTNDQRLLTVPGLKSQAVEFRRG